MHGVYCCSCLLVRGKRSGALVFWFAVTVAAYPPSPTMTILSALFILAADLFLSCDTMTLHFCHFSQPGVSVFFFSVVIH